MAKYPLLKRSHHECRLKVYMHAFMYVNSKTMPVEDYFTDTKQIWRTKRKYQHQDQYETIGLDLSTCNQKVMSLM